MINTLKYFIAFILCIGIGGTGYSIAVADEQDPLKGIIATDLQKAEILEKSEQWEQLESFASSWSNRERGNWKSWYYYGLALFNQQKYADAAKILPLAINLSGGGKTDILKLNADLQSQLEKWRAAEEAYQAIVKIEKNNPAIWAKLLSVVTIQLTVEGAQNKNSYLNVVEIYEKVLTYGAHVNNKQYWSEYATLLELLEDDEKRRIAYSHVLRLDARNLDALEWAYRYDMEHADEAVFARTKKHLQAVAPNHPYLNLHLARDAKRIKDYSGARYYYEKVAKNKKYTLERAEALTVLGEISAIERDGKQVVIKYYLDAIKSDQRYLPAWKRIVIFYRTNGEREKSDKYFSRMLQIERQLEKDEAIAITPTESDLL